MRNKKIVGQKLFSFSIYLKICIFLKYSVTSLCLKRHIAYSFLLLWYLKDTNEINPLIKQTLSKCSEHNNCFW